MFRCQIRSWVCSISNRLGEEMTREMPFSQLLSSKLIGTLSITNRQVLALWCTIWTSIVSTATMRCKSSSSIWEISSLQINTPWSQWIHSNNRFTNYNSTSCTLKVKIGHWTRGSLFPTCNLRDLFLYRNSSSNNNSNFSRDRFPRISWDNRMGNSNIWIYHTISTTTATYNDLNL